MKDGVSAIKRQEQYVLHDSIRTEFDDSLDLDEATRVGRESQNRWDYLLGHSASKKIIGVEPHSATNGEVSTVIAKKKASQLVLQSHVNAGVNVVSWNWVSSGTVGLVPIDKMRLRLAQNGITFVGRCLKKKHLPA